MDVLEAIRTRRTIRAYWSDQVPLEIVREIVDIARLAPSWGNTQPWEFAIVTGEPLEAIKQDFYDKSDADVEPYSDVPRAEFPDSVRQRAQDQGGIMYQAMGIDRDDPVVRREFRLRGAQLFGAPCGIFIYMDRALGPWSMLDVGLVMQTIMLAAPAYDLGTSPLYAMVRYPDVLRRVLAIPDSKQIVCGIALGYPDMEAPQNLYERPRLALEELASWHGFAR